MARPRSRDYDIKRQTILDAAARLFAEHGFANTSVAMLSQDCGGSKAWIYHYYDSKEAVLFALLEDHLRLLETTVREADDPRLAPRERLERLVAALLGAYEDADDKHAVQLADLGRLPDGQQERLKALERRIVEVFARAVVGVSPGLDGRPELVKPVTMSVLGMLNWHHRWFRKDGALSLDEYVRLCVALVVDGLGAVPAR